MPAPNKPKAKKARKRPTPFTEARKKKYLDALRKGCTYGGASGAAGVSRDCADEHREKDPLFAEKVQAAFDQGVQYLEEEAIKRAVEGEEETHTNSKGETRTVYRKSDALLIFALKNKGWSDRQEIKHDHGGSVQILHVPDQWDHESDDSDR